MPVPYPVPSKAAIQALRGLALGTGCCAIGLILEGQRRQINRLTPIAENHKKIRAARGYHHGAAEALIAAQLKKMEDGLGEEACNSTGDEVHWTRPQYGLKMSRDKAGTGNEASVGALQSDCAGHSDAALCAMPTTADDVGKQQSANMSKEPVHHPARRIPGVPQTSKSRAPLGRDSAGWAVGLVAPKPEIHRTMKVSKIMEWLEKDEMNLDNFIREFVKDAQGSNLAKTLGNGWLDLSIALSTYCKSKGRWHDAQKILGAVVRMGPLEEDHFYAHDPIPIIESALPAPDTQDRTSGTNSLIVALKLFLATFKATPRTHSAEIQRFGQTLISLLFAFNQPKYVHNVYWRVMTQAEDPTSFTAWFISALFDYRDDKSVLKYFRLTFSKMDPDGTCFDHIVELVVKTVEAMKGAKVIPVLRALADMSDAGDRSLKTGWLMRLLQAHWGRFKDVAKSTELFQEMLSLRLLVRVENPEYVYKVMVHHCVLAGDNATAQKFFDESVSISPRMADDIGLSGLVTIAKAMAGDWDGVLEDFVNMQPRRGAQQVAYDQIFLSVLKIYCKDHSLSEMDDFVTFYSRQMNVQPHRFLVTFMAKKYGEAHDIQKLINWLRYCSSRGFALDSSFCNAVLDNCRTRWKLPFRNLRKLFVSLRMMSPTLVDDVTKRIMHRAAFMDSNYAGGWARRRVWSMSLRMSKLPYLHKSANPLEVYAAMNEELECRRPAKVIFLYRRALRFGMPWCPHCFRLAVRAALQRGNRFGGAIKLITDTHQLGHDVTSAVSVFIRAQIDLFKGSLEEIMAHVQTLITRFESQGILVHAGVLTHTALACVKSGDHSKAINLCRLAMQRNATTNPCFSKQSFRALLMAYWQTFEVEGVRWLVESLPSSPLAFDKRPFRILKETRRHLRKYKSSPRVDAIMYLLETAIEAAKRRLGSQRDEGHLISDVTLRIVSKAAADFQQKKKQEGNSNGKGGSHSNVWNAAARKQQNGNSDRENHRGALELLEPAITNHTKQGPELVATF